MDIYEYAMQMEKDGENYYRELSRKTANVGLQNILTMLADAEVKHYNVFQSLKKNEDIPDTDTEILSKVKNIFIRMRGEEQTGVDSSQVALYRKAQEIEKRPGFHLEKADEVKASQSRYLSRLPMKKRSIILYSKTLSVLYPAPKPGSKILNGIIWRSINEG
jgi:rubrerythrin